MPRVSKTTRSQSPLWGDDAEPSVPLREDQTSVFTPNMRQAVHRWFRYSAGYSSEWAHDVIAKKVTEGAQHVLDPFVGSGTTLIAAQEAGAESVGFEAHPFVSRVARAKLDWVVDPAIFRRMALEIADTSSRRCVGDDLPPLLAKCFTPDALGELLGLRDVVLSLESGPYADLIWLAFVSIIRISSHVGTAQWQYVLPNKSKSRVLTPTLAYRAQIANMASDMQMLQSAIPSPPLARVIEGDVRNASLIEPDKTTLVVTSPPYANNYDYADATRLEMTVLGEVSSWGDLNTLRQPLVRSCSQHMVRFDLESALDDPILAPIRSELVPVVTDLRVQKGEHGGHKAYDAMIAAYFLDLAQVWRNLRQACTKGSSACFVIGDSAPYGVYVPVERWLGELALAEGFTSWSFEKTRDRNIKWKNRKHRVPLKEGRLWVQG